MCGINGIVGTARDEQAIERLRGMNAALAHRGPDSNGLWTSADGHIGLGHARLAIIDLSDTGAQPMVLGDRSLSMVFNGEVYNFPELRSELVLMGHEFRGHSDSEVVLRAFAQWGPDCFRRLNGMFAVAFADWRRGTVVVARDRLGIKPLHYALVGGGLVFSSEIKGLFASGLVAARADYSRIAEFMYYGVTLGAQTMFDGIKRLPPGCFAEFDVESSTLAISRYWSVEEIARVRLASETAEADPVQEVRRRLDDAVRSHLVSDVPVGVFLSGGIDSSAIVALASRHYSGRLRTYSVGFDYVADTDELPRARLVAERFGTEHHDIHVSGTHLADLLRRLAIAHDVPFSDAANIPLYQLCEALRGETKVVLQGDGGDELFGGYRRYELLDRIGLLGPLARMARPLLGWRFHSRFRSLQRMAAALSEREPAKRMALLLTTELEDCSPIRVLAPSLRTLASEQDPFARYRECAESLGPLDPVQLMLLTDLLIILPDVFLEKVDRATMARSVEVRVPFLDNELVSYVAGLPSRTKVQYGHKKRILRAALRGVVPDEILDAPKAGFGVPFGRWMQGEVGKLLRDLALDPSSDAAGLFDVPVLQRLLKEHERGACDHGFLLWKCLQLALWSQFVLAPARQSL